MQTFSEKWQVEVDRLLDIIRIDDDDNDDDLPIQVSQSIWLKRMEGGYDVYTHSDF